MKPTGPIYEQERLQIIRIVIGKILHTDLSACPSYCALLEQAERRNADREEEMSKLECIEFARSQSVTNDRLAEVVEKQ